MQKELGTAGAVVGMLVLACLFGGLVFAIYPGWPGIAHWADRADAPAWVQAVGSIAAIAASGMLAWWQVGRHAALQAGQLRAEEVRRLQIIGTAIFDCVFSAFIIQRASLSSLSISREIDELDAKLRALSSIAPLDFPDWKAAHAISSAKHSFNSVVEDLRRVPDLRPSTHENRMRYINVVSDAMDFAEGLVRECLLDRGSDVVPIRHMYNDEPVVSKSWTER